MIKIYFAFVCPDLEYSDIVLDNCFDGNAKPLKDIQVATAKIDSVLRSNFQDPCFKMKLDWIQP